jgi:anti-sigma factor RsiW
MNLTRDIVKDLLAVYLAGDASPDTRTIVEEWLATDPDLARQAADARRGDLPAVPPPAPSVEKLALGRTRRRLTLRSVVLGAAIYVTSLPATVTFNRSGFQGLLIDNWTERIVLAVLAGVLWAAYVILSRRLRVPGL